jgi:Ca-activated chloride channel homolog
MTPFTSILALESEAAYSRMGIPRNNSPLRGVKLSALDTTAESRLAQTLAAAAWPTPGAAMGCKGSSSDEPAPMSQREEDYGAQSKAGGVAPAAAPAAPAPTTGLPPEAPAEQAAKTTTASDMPASPPADSLEETARPKVGRSAGGRFRGGGVARAPEPESATTPRPAAIRPGSAGGGIGAAGGDARKETEDKPLGTIGLMAGGKPTSGWTAPPVLSTCSDASARPLAQRVLVWKKRIKTAGSEQELIQRYESARLACEVNDWLAERIFLDLMQRQVDSAAGVEVILRHFGTRPEVQKFLAKLVLRRAVDVAMVTSVEKMLFGSAVDWNEVDLELQAIEDPEKRLTKLREYAARAPADPNGGIRLVRLLIAGNHRDEALALGTRLRDQGFVTPHIARQLGDVLARAKLDAEAVRTYSEIVEFDPESTASRRLLGDIYLGHGWYEPAYRQYRTITDAAPQDALGWLRLAAAAAGTGRVDEALRVERKVASAQGTPGPSDPRRWARLASAARLGRLIERPPSAPGAGKIPPESLKRELKELQLFGGPSTLVVLTWEELDANVVLATRIDGREVALGESTDAAGAGLASVLLSTPDAQRSQFAARLRSLPRDHGLKLIRHDISWDGKDFKVTVTDRELATKATESVL